MMKNRTYAFRLTTPPPPPPVRDCTLLANVPLQSVRNSWMLPYDKHFAQL